MALSTSIRVALTATQRNPGDLGTAIAPITLKSPIDLADGTGAGQANRVFADTRTISASGSEDLDLAGVLLDRFGAAITFARIKALYVKASPLNTNNVIVGADSEAGWIAWLGADTDAITLRPGATLLLAAGEEDAVGYAVTATTADLLQISNSAGSTSVTYDIVLIGCSS